MIGGLYYQNQIFENQLNQYKSIVAEKETYINKIVDEERVRLIEREKYLISQRDAFLQDLKSENQMLREKLLK